LKIYDLGNDDIFIRRDLWKDKYQFDREEAFKFETFMYDEYEKGSKDEL